MSQMPKDIEARIRALPGNGICCDCSNVNPQWASVTYGCLMCLDCSGHHRSMGVHLSFVRSIAMDSWTEKQITAMEKAGGNAKLIECLSQRGIPKEMKVHQKYDTKQAKYFRDRLARWLEGKTEPPPDPGRYDPLTGVSEAQGAEPLAGESTEQYNERQAKLREAARERMRQKFGNGHMSGVGSGGSMSFGSPEPESQGILGSVGGFIGKIADNDRVKGVAGGVLGMAGSGVDALKRAATDGDIGSSLKGNVTLQEDSAVRRSLGFLGGIVGKGAETVGLKQQSNNPNGPYVCKKGSAPPDDFFDQLEASGDGVQWNDRDALDRRNSAPPGMTASPMGNGGYGGAKSNSFGNDDWGNSSVNQTSDNFSQLNVSASKTPTNGNSAYDMPKPAPAPKAVSLPAKSPMAMPEVAKAAPKKAAVKLASSDDFFAEFGM